MSLVKGFTDIIAPQNLATNGSFMIDQRRGVVTATVGNKVGDYVADCWYISESNLDFVRVDRYASARMLEISGNGKKGQVILLRNSDSSGLNSSGSSASFAGMGQVSVTAAVNAVVSANSVPVRVGVNPRIFSGIYASKTYEKAPILSSRNAMAQTVYVAKYVPYGSTGCNILPTVGITLQADGDFSVRISDFMELAGEFINPPKFAPVPYADDLLRCKRYYQVVQAHIVTGGADNGIDYLLASRVMFPVQMAGTPTVELFSGNYVKEEGSNTAITGAPYTFTTDYVTAASVDCYAYKPAGGNKPNELYVNLGLTV